MEHVRIRNAEASDYLPIISVVNAWWDGRNMRDMLPKLFFVHFRQTSFVAEADGHRQGPRKPVDEVADASFREITVNS